MHVRVCTEYIISARELYVCCDLRTCARVCAVTCVCTAVCAAIFDLFAWNTVPYVSTNDDLILCFRSSGVP